jgi:hypothetical protein
MTSRSVVALRHVHFEDLGHFAPILERHGYGLTYCDVGIDSLKSLDPLAAGLLIVLGARSVPMRKNNIRSFTMSLRFSQVGLPPTNRRSANA